jgi:hypothetical protein
MGSWKVWFYGLAAAVISAFSTAAGAFIVMPNVFNFGSKESVGNAVKIVIVPTALAVFAYLKASPIPPLTATVDAKGNITNVQGSVDVSVTSPKN